MNDQSVENPAILQRWLQERRSRAERDKEEKNMQIEARKPAVVVPTHETMQENNEAAETVAVNNLAEKDKKTRVQSVFSLVRSQVKTQAGLDGQRILDVVHQVTKELEKNKREQEESAPSIEITLEEEETAGQGDQRETVEDGMLETADNSKQRGEEVCVALLEEVLLSLESLKCDLREEMAQLRREMQSSTERAFCSLETRLTNLLKIHVPSALPSRHHTAEAVETRKHRPPSMPPLGASRRRMLSRTMTTITPKTCLPLSLGPRSNSEPLGTWSSETATSGGAQMLMRKDDTVGQPAGPLPPARPPVQTSKKALRSRTRINKPTS